jgi:hypothetical protein
LAYRIIVIKHKELP